MAVYRNNLPQLSGELFLTDGGIETTLIFHDGLDLPLFAAFDALRYEAGQAALRRYFETYAAIARDNQMGIILEAPTWRASQDWGDRLGYSPADLERANRQAIALLEEVREATKTETSKIVISGCVGPRGDGYVVGDLMSPDQAQRYHEVQINTFRDTSADMISALTMTYVDEAIGVTRAAKAAGLPVAISFTLETDGRLPSGLSLEEAIKQVDAATDSGPVYYMINCAHPTHFQGTLDDGEGWTWRIGGLRANASRLSHAELNEAEELDDGNPAELADEYRQIRDQLSALNVVGGCCGTDHRHIEQIARTCRLHPVLA